MMYRAPPFRDADRVKICMWDQATEPPQPDLILIKYFTPAHFQNFENLPQKSALIATFKTLNIMFLAFSFILLELYPNFHMYMLTLHIING